MMGEGSYRPLGQAGGSAHLQQGGVTARRLILPYKGVPGDAAVVVFEFPLFLLFLFLVSVRDVLASVSPHPPIVLPLLLVLQRLPLCLIRGTVRRPHGLAPRQRRQVFREREVPRLASPHAKSDGQG
jgi:hypothetical protein